MTTSPVLGLPLIAASQATPEITHNEALLLIQILAYGVKQVALNSVPGAPTEGDSYVIGAAPGGAWAGKANKLTIYYGGSWRFLPDVDSDGTDIPIGAAHEGMRVWSKADDAAFVFTGSAWLACGGGMVEFAKASLPVATGPKRLIYVTDDVGGATPAFNDGVNWRRVADRAVIS